MSWGAVSLEVGLLILAFVVLAWDLAVGHRSAGLRKTDYILAGLGLLVLLGWSFRLPVGISFTDALVQEKGWAAEGDSIVYVLGHRMGKRNLSNLVYIHQVGNL